MAWQTVWSVPSRLAGSLTMEIDSERIPIGFPMGTGWVWGLKFNLHGSPVYDYHYLVTGLYVECSGTQIRFWSTIYSSLFIFISPHR